MPGPRTRESTAGRVANGNQVVAGVRDVTTGGISMVRDATNWRTPAVVTQRLCILTHCVDCDDGKAIRNITPSADERLIDAAREERSL